MLYFMPEIIYHDRKPLLSVDIHPSSSGNKYRMVTSSMQDNIRIWELEFENETADSPRLGLSFIVTLEGHYTPVSQVRFSPNIDVNLLASGDVYGRIFIWKLSDTPCADNYSDPRNGEKWIRSKVFYHESDVTAICWDPDGKHIASVSGDATLRVHDALSGRHKFIVRNLRYYPCGVSYDPLGKYIVTMSTDRKMDVICAKKGTRLCHFGPFIELPHVCAEGIEFKKNKYQMFCEDILTSYTRVCAFSPCGQLLVAPAGHLHPDKENAFYCSYVYKRSVFNQDKPIVILRSPNNPTFLVRFCPIIFELVSDSPNYSELPYRVIWLALTQDELIIYDSQHYQAIGLVKDITYRCLTDCAWANDGRLVVLTDSEEYVHYIHFAPGEFGNEIKTIPHIPDPPHFKKSRVLSNTAFSRGNVKTTATLKKKNDHSFTRSNKPSKIHQQKINQSYKPVLPSWKNTPISKKELEWNFKPIRANSKENINTTGKTAEIRCETGRNNNQKDNVTHNPARTLLKYLLPKKDKRYYSALSPKPCDTKGAQKKRPTITTLS